MGITLARIDNRLLHGIVATQWAGRSGAQRIMIIDDGVANNELTKASMKLARPTGMAISINFKAGKYEDHNVFVIVKSPVTLESLSEAGVKIPELVVGGTTRPDESVHSVKLYQRAYATDREIEAYKVLKGNGTKIYAQYVPADSVVNLDEFLR